MSSPSISRRFNISNPSQPAKANIRQAKVQQSESTQYDPLNCTITGSGLMVGTSGVDVMCATGTANILALGANDTLYAYNGTGTTYLNGGSGADQLIGGNGTNIANYSDSSSAITVDIVECAQGCMSPGSDADGDTMINITGVIGSNSDDVISAGFGAPPVLSGQSPDISFVAATLVGPDKNYMAAVWGGSSDGINGQIFATNGTSLSSPFQVSNSNSSINPQLLVVGGKFVVTWSDIDNSSNSGGLNVYMRAFEFDFDVDETCLSPLDNGSNITPVQNSSNSTLAPCNPLLLLSDVTNYIALLVNEIIFLAYQTNIVSSSSSSPPLSPSSSTNQTAPSSLSAQPQNITGISYQLDGGLSDQFNVVNSSNSSLSLITLFSAVVLNDGGVFIAWKQADNFTDSNATVSLQFKVFDINGTSRTSTQVAFTVETRNEKISQGLTVSLNDGAFVMTWLQQFDNGGQSYLRLYNSSYVPQDDATVFRSNYFVSSLLASNSGGFFMVGTNIIVASEGLITSLLLFQYDDKANVISQAQIDHVAGIRFNGIMKSGSTAIILPIDNSNYVIPYVNTALSVSLGTYPGGISASYVFWGLGGNDTLTGAFGNDIFHPGPGNNTVNGWYGTDTAVYDALPTDVSIAVILNATCSGLATRSNGELDVLMHVENFNGTPGDDSFSILCNMSVFAGGGGSNTYSMPQPKSPTFARVVDFGSLDTLLAPCACSNVTTTMNGPNCQVKCSDALTLYTYDIGNTNCSRVNTTGNGMLCSITAEVISA